MALEFVYEVIGGILSEGIKKTIHFIWKIIYSQDAGAQSEIDPVPVFTGTGDAVIGDSVCRQKLLDKVQHDFFQSISVLSFLKTRCRRMWVLLC